MLETVFRTGMLMNRLIPAYFAALAAFCVLDGIWLWATRDYYQSQIGSLLRAEPKLAAAAGFYLVYLAGLVVLAVMPALERNSSRRCAGLSALLGVCAYGTYGLTNYALLNNWPLGMTVLDIAWGATLSMLAGLAGYWLAKSLSLRNRS